MKKVISIMALMLLQISCFAVTVETTVNLNVYYPEYSKIDLVCGQMPKAAQMDVEFCCEAAFTGELLNEFKHSNIADNHICNWNYAWYRDKDGKVKEVFPESKLAPNYKYRTNWIAFYK